jgi:hypothetical protein
LVEGNRRHIALTRPTLGITSKGGVISSMSAMWLIPQLSLSGFSEGFNYISQIKFYYKQFIENMRSDFLLCAKWYRYKDGDNSTVEMVTKGSHKHIV